jgi:ParB family chromosome partitioning protein
MQTIEIAKVTIQSLRRPVRSVADLAESIKNIGLINPITVTPDYMLIAGLHRLEACKSLGWSEIPFRVLSLNEIDTHLAEIDENLIRNELTVLDRSEQLKARKELYEAKFPQTKHGAIGNGRSRDAESASLNFTKDTAAKTSKSPRTISEDVQIAKNIPEPIRDQIRDTPLADKKTELVTLSRFDETTQQEVVELIAEDKAGTVEEALKEIAKKPNPEGFKSAAQVALENKNSIGSKWRESLAKTLVELNAIRDNGGIQQLTEKWSDEHKYSYIERCREYARTLTEYADIIEKTL